MPRRTRAERDPMASETDDDDFSPGADARPAKRPAKRQKTSGKSTSKGAKNKRSKRKGSGIDSDDDEELDDSLDDASFDDEEVTMNPTTGRRIRGSVAKSQPKYDVDGSEDEEEEMTEDSDDDPDPSPKKPARKGRTAAAQIPDDEDDEEEPAPVKSRIIKLRVGKNNLPPATPEPDRRRGKSARSMQMTTASRAGSVQRSTRNTSSIEPLLDGLPPTTRRMTRARSGEVAEVAQPSSRTARRAVGTKGLMVAATIKEEIHETSSYEQPAEGDETVATEIQGTDDQDEPIYRSDPAQEIVGDQLVEEQSETGEAQPAMDSIEDEEDDDDDEEGGPIKRTRASRQTAVTEVPTEEVVVASDVLEDEQTTSRRTTRAKAKPKKADEAISDFDPEEAGTDASMSDNSAGPAETKNRAQVSKASSRNNRDSTDSIDAEEVREELDEIRPPRNKRKHYNNNADNSHIEYEQNKRRRTANRVTTYRIPTMNEVIAAESEEAAPEPTRRTKNGKGGGGGGWDRSLYSAFGPFGGGGGPPPVISGPWGTGATGGVDSDSSDDEGTMRPSNVGGNVGMTPTSAFPAGLLPGMGQTNNPDPFGAAGATPNVGKIKSQKALADADPLGVDQNVDFSKIGGLDGHIDQLKEMVMMPLLYPELFQKFKVTPPRGVLFHGPPGTGKTLLARALAASVGSSGKKVTFYMRKGADALSKWVGEAERQLRLLFEEARKTQPSIIFFDEIDGLAPVRSSKQEQIHASIVSTLLALMDGMDGRGQVIVIGATNRPDNIDPALRRPGRFDREFYFPLPGLEARKSILNIHTKDWEVDDTFKTKLAELTKGYGGADLRALCTEAALNSIQRTYPQIYSSNDKLLLDPDKIKVNAKDFMLSIKKMVPSSERSTSSGATPLPKVVEPLLRAPLIDIEKILDGLIPIKKKTTALQEAMFEQYDDDDFGFQRETMQQDFERSRVFRPRLLICGEPGMGQQYLGGAILNHFEGLHVQSFDLPTIYSESSRSPESAIVQLFAEVKRHKPSVIYLPGVDMWYATLPENVITTFLGLLKAIPPNDPVMVLGITDTPQAELDPMMLRDLFGFSEHNRFTIKRPTKENRAEFFQPIIDYARKCPRDFPEPLNRKLRKLEVLPLAPIPPPIPPTKDELKALKKRDHQILNLLKIQIQPIMDQIQKRYRKFRNPVIPRSDIEYLYDESDPGFVQPDLAREVRPYEIDVDKNGVTGLRQTATGKFFYNLETTLIEERLSNGYYARPKDFLADIKTLAKDAKAIEDRERTLKANELVANVEVDIATYEAMPTFADCENIYLRRIKATKEAEEKAKVRAAGAIEDDVFNPVASDITSQFAAPILGEAIPGRVPLMTPLHVSSHSNGYGASNERTSNGTSVPSRGGDTQMTGVDSGMSQGSPMHPPMHRGVASGQNTQISQRSAWQEVSLGTSPSQMHNDASTTTSGKKTSEGWSTQATNGISNQYSSPMDRPQQESYQANTQGNNTQETSSEEWPHSQAHGVARGVLHNSDPSQTSSSSQYSQAHPVVPPFPAPPRIQPVSRPAGMANLLNDTPVEPMSSQLSSQKDPIIDEAFVTDLLRHLVDGSSGCSVEQLEQVFRELMDTLWAMRGEWNRSLVTAKLVQVFNVTIHDIEAIQKVQMASQPTDNDFSLPSTR